jgi:tellurite resistance protein TerC
MELTIIPLRKHLRLTEGLRGNRFWSREATADGKGVALHATPLFLALLLVELFDLVFAVDSVPAVLAVTHEQYIAFASNAFAILGLRSLYFLLADMRDRFQYLQTGLGVIMAFVGVKMVLSHWVHMPIAASLAVIALILGVSIVASMRAAPTAQS